MNNIEIIDGDLTYYNAKKEYENSLVVKGDIHAGIDIVIMGDLVVEGNVEACRIKCFGEVKINKNFLGQSKGVIYSKGTFFSNQVVNGNVKCDEEIVIGNFVSYSNLLSRKSITINGKGKVIGGNLYAKDSIKGKECGVPAIVETNLYVGYDYIKKIKFDEISRKIKKLAEKIEHNEEIFKRKFEDINYNDFEIDKIMKNLNKLDKNKNLLLKLLENIELKEKVNEFIKSLKEFEYKKLANLNAFVKFERIFPGVNIQILEKRLNVIEEILLFDEIINMDNIEKWQQ